MSVRAAAVVIAFLACACSKNSTPSTGTTPPAAPTVPTAALTITFEANPVPFNSSGCSFSTPQGWFTQARIQETGGVAVTVASLVQKLDGATSSVLSESFNSRFGACSGGTFSPGTIAASGAVCGTVGICSTSAFSTYQFSIAGTDANGHAIAVDSPVLRLGSRP